MIIGKSVIYFQKALKLNQIVSFIFFF